MKRLICSLLALLSSQLPAAESQPAPSAGLQLYSLRSQFALRGVPWTLDRVKEFGIKEVELAGTYNLSAEQFKAELDARGLKPISSHFPYARLKLDLDGVVREAKTLGVKFAGCAWIDHKDAFDEAEARAAAALFNHAGEALAKEGITFFYHCHGYEFQPHGEGTLFDLLVHETKPEHVSFQMDVLWVVFPGQNPVALLEKHASRWKLMHLKDLKKGVATGSLSGKTDVTNDVTLGSGQMDWPAIFSAAKKNRHSALFHRGRIAVSHGANPRQPGLSPEGEGVKRLSSGVRTTRFQDAVHLQNRATGSCPFFPKCPDRSQEKELRAPAAPPRA